MPTINGKTINIISLNESHEIVNFSYINFTGLSASYIPAISSGKRVIQLVLNESLATTLTNSVYTDLETAFLNNTTVSVVLDLSFHNRGNMSMYVIALACRYEVNQVRTIEVSLIES